MSEQKRVIVLGDVALEATQLLEDAALRVDVARDWDEAQLLQRLPEYDALLAGPEATVSAGMLAAARRLQVVARAAAGPGAIDVDEATRRAVIVVDAPAAGVVSEAEQALALLLAVARDSVAADARLRAGEWDAAAWADAAADLAGKTLGIFGAGAWAPALAEAARALRMSILLAGPADAPVMLECVDMARVLADADFIVAGAPTGDCAALGAAEFGSLRRGVRLVDFDGVTDPEALAAALGSGDVAAAAVRIAGPGIPGALAAAPHVVFAPRLDPATADARRRAGVAAAEGITDVLAGGFPRATLNVPVAQGEDAGELRPYVDLCDQLGRLLVQLAGAPVDAVEVTYGGSIAYFDTRLLTLGVLAGLVRGRADGPVNFVNAAGIAARLGVKALENPQPGVAEFPRLIEVSAQSPGGVVSVAGTSLGSEHKPRLVRVFGEDVDVVPAPHMAFLRYVDAPGVGGKLGTLLGEWGINIGHMSVGRGKLGDESVMALTLDEPLSPQQAEELVARCGLSFARAVEL